MMARSFESHDCRHTVFLKKKKINKYTLLGRAEKREKKKCCWTTVDGPQPSLCKRFNVGPRGNVAVGTYTQTHRHTPASTTLHGGGNERFQCRPQSGLLQPIHFLWRGAADDDATAAAAPYLYLFHLVLLDIIIWRERNKSRTPPFIDISSLGGSFISSPC